MNTTIKEILERNGYSVAGQAYDGPEAIEIFRKSTPDFVVLDITMPLQDGFDVMAEIRKMGSDTKIIMCTGYWQPSIVLKSLRKGADGYVMKPFMPETLLHAIDETLKAGRVFDQEIIGTLLENEKIKEIDKRNVITSQSFIDKLIDACSGGGTEYFFNS